jgi:hypothetical protein
MVALFVFGAWTFVEVLREPRAWGRTMTAALGFAIVAMILAGRW